MKIRHLKYLVAVAKDRSFTRAARRLHVSQPSLWAAIKNMEDRLGSDLFVRERRGLELTDGGQAFVHHIERALTEINLAESRMRELTAAKSDLLQIGGLAPAIHLVLQKILPELRRRWPNLIFQFERTHTAQIIDGVHRGEYHVGMCWSPFPRRGLDVCTIAQDRLTAVVPATHRLASRNVITLTDLRDEAFFLPDRMLAPHAFKLITQLFQNADVPLRVTRELKSSADILDLVAMGLGCSLLPAYTRYMCRTGVVLRPFEPSTAINLAAIKLKRASKPAESLFELLRALNATYQSDKPKIPG
jgi:DNA-binding transcriptional LysR family regulator